MAHAPDPEALFEQQTRVEHLRRQIVKTARTLTDETEPVAKSAAYDEILALLHAEARETAALRDLLADWAKESAAPCHVL